MSNETEEYLRQILWYTAIWSIIAVSLFIFLRWRNSRLYTRERYEYLITTVSDWRQKAADPCQFSIFGDPVTSEGIFARVTFYCGKNKVANNSMDLTVLSENNYAALLRETARINGFSAEEMINTKDGSWKCFDDHDRINNLLEKVKVRSRVECFYDYSETEIRDFYAKN